MFNQDLTIINKVYNKNTRQNTYKTSHLHGFWSSSEGISISNTNLVKNDEFKAIILISESGYVIPKDFIDEGWTLRIDDYIAKGIIDKVISLKDLKEQYECMKITNVVTKDYGSLDMQHFEISGE